MGLHNLSKFVNVIFGQFLNWLNNTWSLFQNDSELYAINKVYLAPFAGDSDYIRYHRREMKGGGFVLGINVGLALQGIILPNMVHRQDGFMGEMLEITESFLYMQRNFPAPEPKTAETTPDSPEQHSVKN